MTLRREPLAGKTESSTEILSPSSQLRRSHPPQLIDQSSKIRNLNLKKRLASDNLKVKIQLSAILREQCRCQSRLRLVLGRLNQECHQISTVSIVPKKGQQIDTSLRELGKGVVECLVEQAPLSLTNTPDLPQIEHPPEEQSPSLSPSLNRGQGINLGKGIVQRCLKQLWINLPDCLVVQLDKSRMEVSSHGCQVDISIPGRTLHGILQLLSSFLLQSRKEARSLWSMLHWTRRCTRGRLHGTGKGLQKGLRVDGTRSAAGSIKRLFCETRHLKDNRFIKKRNPIKNYFQFFY